MKTYFLDNIRKQLFNRETQNFKPMPTKEKFPVYVTYGDSFFKVISDTDYYEVCIDKNDLMICRKSNFKIMAHILISRGKEISKEEFDEAYMSALKYLSEYCFMQVTTSDEIFDRNQELQSSLNNIGNESLEFFL